MSAISKSVASACISVLFLLGTLPAQTTDEAGPPSDVSKVRIVRLSEVRGAVQLDRNTGRGYEPTLANLPIVEHSRLQTGMGIAEVEFEDNSTLRVAPGSTVEFTQLGRLPDGTTTSSVRLIKGTAYVSLLKTRGNQFNLLFGQQNIQLPPNSHIRLQTDGTLATLAVLDGTVRIDGSAGPTDVSKKNTATFYLLNQAEPTLAKNIVPGALDAWDKTAAQSHSQPVANTAFGSPYSYGLGDMMYYGAFTNVAGCGSMWRPYFASAAWDPYSNGAWAWYQGAGYSLGISLSLGMDAVSLRQLVLLLRRWLGMATGRLLERTEQRNRHCVRRRRWSWVNRRPGTTSTSPHPATRPGRTHSQGVQPEACSPFGGDCRLLRLPAGFSRSGRSPRGPGQTQ